MNPIRAATLLGLTLMLAGIGTTAVGQTAMDTTQVEIAAARAMLAHREAGNLTFALDPRLALTEHEDWGKARAVRTSDRTAAIAQALGGSVRTLEEVTCGKCHLRGVSAHLSLGSLQIQGTTATISALLIQNLPNDRTPTFYESVRFTLCRTATGWVVSREEQLGSS